MTRTPKPAAPRFARPPRPPPRPPPPRPPRPPPSPSLRSLPPLALTPLLTLRVKRMSAYVQPIFFASPSATSENPLNGDCNGSLAGDCAISSPTRSDDATRRAEAPVHFRKSRRDGFMKQPQTAGDTDVM